MATHLTQNLFLLAAIIAVIRSDPNICFHYPDVLSMHNCISGYFAQGDTLTATEWAQMLPTDAEIIQYKQLLTALLSANDMSVCGPNLLVNYPEISDDIQLQLYQNTYCIIVEKNLFLQKNIFRRSWGYVMIADRSWARRNIYHSAPHFQSDIHTDSEAAVIFDMSRGRSVVIAGASRYAVQNEVKSPCITQYYAADASHDNRTMFFAANSAMFAYQGACPHDSCAFIQWHGKGADACADVSAFVSAGINNEQNTYSLKSLPANKIADAFNQFGTGVAKTPKDSTCNLVAAANVFGRLINGVPMGNVCNTFTAASSVSGAFVHIEQAIEVRIAYARWTQTLASAFMELTGTPGYGNGGYPNSCGRREFVLLVGYGPVTCVITSYCVIIVAMVMTSAN